MRDDVLLMAIGDIIRLARRGKGLTMQQLANRVGCTQPHVSQVESGKTQPSLVMARRFASALEIDVNLLQPRGLRKPATDKRRARTVRVEMPLEVYEALILAADEAGTGVGQLVLSLVEDRVGRVAIRWEQPNDPLAKLLSQRSEEE